MNIEMYIIIRSAIIFAFVFLSPYYILSKAKRPMSPGLYILSYIFWVLLLYGLMIYWLLHPKNNAAPNYDLLRQLGWFWGK